MTEIKDIEQLLFYELQVLWSAESLLIEEMPKMITVATHFGLKKNLKTHLAETSQHLAALELICNALRIKKAGDYSPGMKGILTEFALVSATHSNPTARDAAIIAAAQKAVHYEISTYSSAAYYGEVLGMEGIAQRLRMTLAEEQEADIQLNFLAKSILNPKAEAKKEIY